MSRKRFSDIIDYNLNKDSLIFVTFVTNFSDITFRQLIAQALSSCLTQRLLLIYHNQNYPKKLLIRVQATVEILRPNFWNFSKTFSKYLPMSDDLGIPKKFSFLNFWRLCLRFQRTSFFSYLFKLLQPIRCAYTDHVM